MKKTIAFVLGWTLAAAPGFALAEPGVTDKEILIGSCLPFEGTSQDAGKDLDRGAKAFINYINGRGGINGRKLRRVVYNDAYDTEKAITCFNQLLTDGVFAGAVFYGSPTGAKYMSMGETNKVPVLGFAAGAGFLYHPIKHYVFAVRASFEDETRDMVEHLWNDLGMRRMAAIYQNDAGGVPSLDGVNKALKNHNATLAAIGSYTRNSLDVDSAIDSVRPVNPEVVFLLGPYAPASEVAKRGKALGWTPLYAGVGPRDYFPKAAGDAGEGAIVSLVAPSPNSTQFPLIALYRKQMKKDGIDAQASYYALEAFIEMAILSEGLKLAGRELTRDKLVDALESLHNFDIGLGPQFKVNYGPESHGAFAKVSFGRAHNGALEVIEDWSKLKAQK